MKKLLIILLAIGSLTSGKLTAGNEKRRSGPIDTFTVKCLVSSANLFYAAELGEKPSLDKVDTLAGSINYTNSQNVHLALVSAADLGFENLDDVKWDEILDSAISHGYQVCPQQMGPELYLLSQCKKLQNLPANVPIFIGMQEIKEIVQKRFIGITAKNENGYVFCLKSDCRRKKYQLGYSTTASSNKHYCWTAADKFLFVKVK
jgi:hypothetical protein